MMQQLARAEPGRPMSLGAVASATGISRRYLDQLAGVLKRAGLLNGRAGRSGGYALARSPRDIDLGQIVTATIGPINIVDCVLEPRSCLKSEVCDCRSVYQVINHRIAEVFSSITLADMLDPRSLAALVKHLDANGH
jgi:Rrf2 family protein